MAAADIEEGKPISFVSGDQREVDKYLKEVYIHLTGLFAMSFVGCYVQLHSGLYLFFPAFIAAMGCLLYVFLGKDPTLRPILFMGFGFFDGWMLGPLLTQLHPPPATILGAVAMTTGIFGSFTLAAMYGKRGAYLYLGGFLGSAIWGLLAVSIMSIFFHVPFFYSLMLYGGLIVFSLYVMYDTSVMIERAHAGERDHLVDALNLFIDAMAIFRRVLIIMSQNE